MDSPTGDHPSEYLPAKLDIQLRNAPKPSAALQAAEQYSRSCSKVKTVVEKTSSLLVAKQRLGEASVVMYREGVVDLSGGGRRVPSRFV
jgi:hypothetical protein